MTIRPDHRDLGPWGAPAPGFLAIPARETEAALADRRRRAHQTLRLCAVCSAALAAIVALAVIRSGGF